MNNTVLGVLSAIFILVGSWMLSWLTCSDSATPAANFSVKDSNFSTSSDDPFTFKPSSATLIAPAATKASFKKIAEYLKANEDRALHLVGYSYFGEKKGVDVTYENLGIARAEAVKNAILNADNEAPEAAITTEGKMINNIQSKEEVLLNPVSFSFLEKKTEELNDILSGEPEVNAFDDLTKYAHVLAYDLELKEVDTDFQNYFDRARGYLLENPNSKFSLTGFYYNESKSSSSNQAISLRQAKNLRDILKKEGIPSNQIITQGKGDDATEGQNNRIEIILVKE